MPSENLNCFYCLPLFGLPSIRGVALDPSLSILITMGVLLGRLTPVQFLVLAFIETSLTVLLEHLLYNLLFINDAGRSLVVHCFGAYFGLAAAKICHKKNTMVVDDDETAGNFELFAMLGTLFIWSFFPSFNAGSIPHSTPEMRHRAFLNSYLAMAACTTATFMLSSLADHLGNLMFVAKKS